MSANRFLILLIPAAILSLAACADRGEQPVDSLHPGGVPVSYRYRAYNAKGDLAVDGTFTLTSIDSATVSGTWSFVAILPAEKIGPQTGTGKLRGTIQKSSISIDLNPGWADNNVFLQGIISSDSIAGTWMWSTFAGPTSEGRFQAMRTVPTQISTN
jgi:hypothetical protein